jgi:peptide/nickel transport system permease protein
VRRHRPGAGVEAVWQYTIKRILLMIPTLVGAALVVFLLMNVVPGDTALLILGTGEQGGDVNPQDLARLRAKLGLDRPVHEQFLSWLWGIVRLDFGNSLWSGAPISQELGNRLPLTLQVALFATLISTLIAIPLGTLAAIRQDTWVDYLVRVVSIGGLAIPAFWTGILIILFLVIYFEWSPPLIFVSIWEDPWENFKQLVWPIVTVGYRNAAIGTRMTRSAVLEVMREDYIRTAWAKGLQERIVVIKHTLKNAMLPVITIIGAELAFLMGGLVVTETVFTLNGLGRFMVDAILRRDIPVVQTMVLLTAFAIVFVNLIVDLLYAWLDPRISYR